MITILFVLFLGYILGSIPSAIIAGRLLKKIDIREHGSGNAGATNVLRVLGWKAAIVVFIIDMMKGFIPVWLFIDLIPDTGEYKVYYQLLIGICAICGHIWPVFAGFKGGKGVLTMTGVFLGMQPVPVIICLIIFIIVLSITKYVSLGSMIAALFLPVIIFIEKVIFNMQIPGILVILTSVLAILIIIMHRENISRLIQGNENKISLSKK